MEKSIFAAVLVSALVMAGCGIFGSDPRSPIIKVASGDYDTLLINAKDTVAFSVWTPRTPETVDVKSRTQMVSVTIARTGSSTDTAFTGSVFIAAGAYAGQDTVEIRLLYNGGEDAVKNLFITVQ